MEEVYRFRAVGPATAVFGLIGNPALHSRSPLIHNTGFAALGIDAVYVPFTVPDLQGFWGVADGLGITGLSVTVPHKQAVLDQVKVRDEIVARVGACNTITREGEAWRGTNTDVEGFLALLRAAFTGKIPEGMGATVIGAGGAARAVVHGLTGAGFRVMILNRTPERPALLPRRSGRVGPGSIKEALRDSRVFGTSSCRRRARAWHPHVDTDPASDFPFTGRELVYELGYAPVMRQLLSGGHGLRGVR